MATQYSKTAADPKVILDLKVNAKEAIDAIIAAQEQIAKLKEEQRSLEQQMKSGNGSKEAAQRLVLLKTEIKDLNTVIKANEKELDNQVKSYKQNGDSLNAMRAQLKSMRAEFEDLSKADRDSEFGQQMLKNIQTLTVDIKQLEQAQGDFTRSVGTYGKLFDTTADQMQSFGSVLSSVFGSNSIIGKAATVVTGFGRSITDMSKQITDMASTAQASTKDVTDLGTAATSAASGMSSMGDAAGAAETVVQGFGAAERAAADAAKAMSTEEAAASTAAATTASTAATAEKATKGLAGGFQAAGTAVKAMSKSLLSLLANPYVAAFAAIVVIVMKLVDAFKKNDAAMTALQKAFSVFQPILDVINKIFNAIVGTITKVIDGFSKLATKILSIIPGFKQASEAAQQFTQDMDDLEEAERQYTVESAKNEAQIAKLRDQAADKEKYTAEERKKFLQEAIKLEEKNYQSQKALAAERLRLSKIEQKRDNDYSDERANKIAELEAAYIKADADYANAHRSLMKEQNRFDKEIESDQKQAEQERKQRAKQWAQTQKELRENELKAQREYQDAVLAAMDEGLAKQLASVKQTGEREIEDLKKRLKEEKNLTKAAREAINKTIELKQKELNKNLILTEATYWSEWRETAAKALSSAISFIDSGKLSTDFKAARDLIQQNVTKIAEDAKSNISGLNDAFKKELDILAKTSKVARAYMRFTPVIDIQSFQSQMNALAETISKRTGKDGWETIINMDGTYNQLEQLYKKYREVLASQQRQLYAQIDAAAANSAKEMQTAIFNSVTNGSVDAFKSFMQTVPEYARDMATRYGDNVLDQMRGILSTIDSEIDARYADIANFTGTNETMLEQAKERLAILQQVRQVILNTHGTEEENLRLRQEQAQLILAGQNTAVAQAQIALREAQSERDKLLIQQQYLNSLEEEVRAKEAAYNASKDQQLIETDRLEKQKLELENSLAGLQAKVDVGIEVDVTEMENLRAQIAQIEADEMALVQATAAAAQELAATGFTSMEEFNAAQAEMETSIMESNARIAESTKELQNAEIDSWSSTFNSVADAAGALGGAFGELFNTLAEDNEEMQKYANAMALVNIMVNMAQGIATAVAKGMEMGWPAAIAVIPLGIAAVVSGIASAIAIFKKQKVKSAPKFAEGGLVGNRTTTKTDDKIHAKLSEGEYVIKSRVVKALGVDFFDALNGKKRNKLEIPMRFASGGVVPSLSTISSIDSQISYSDMGEAIREAVADVHPVVSVQEINSVQTRVTVKEQTASYN